MPARRPRIDPELRALIPPLAAEEQEQLEANLVANGCRDALVVWKDRGILLDGHHRFEICERLGISYRTTEVELPDREAAKDWIDGNQLGRRNLTPDAFTLLLGRRYNRTKKAHGGDRRSSGQNDHLNVRTCESLATEHAVSEKTVRRAGKFARQVERDPELAKAIANRVPVRCFNRERKERQREARRQENRDRIAAAPTIAEAVTDARFATIVADPPWRYRSDPYGRTQPEYATMAVDDLAALPVGERADDDAHMYLWTTNSHLRPAFEVLTAWGFRYVTMLTWCKPRFGMGSYFRAQTEHVLFGVRGSQPLKRKDVGTCFEAPVGKHSEKPAAFYDLVESCSPGPYLELFARQPREGWVTWGGEL